MAILYPDQIENIYIRGEEFTGNVVSVGLDGNYAYDYNHPKTATDSEPNGTLVLIYPGSYTPSNMNNREILWRGMGELPTDINFYANPGSEQVLYIQGNFDLAILENIGADNGYSAASRSVMYIRDGSATTNFYANKSYFDRGGGGYSPSYWNFEDYFGNVYFSYNEQTSSDSRNGHVNGIANSNINATYDFVAIEYNYEFRCYGCSKYPDPHTYSTSPADGYGYDYGDYLIKFNKQIIDIYPIYQNVWSQGDYIYHTASSGIDVYNDDASSVLNRIELPTEASAVWANDNYVYMGTTGSGVYRSTVSGTATQYLTAPDITGNNIIYLHGSGMYLCLTTESGVDRWDFTLSSGISTQSRYIHKCRQVADGTFYYIKNNLFYSVDEQALGGNLEDWTYYQHFNFAPTDDADLYFEVIFDSNFLFSNAQANGEDLRFLDIDGNNLTYYIKDWYPAADVLVKVALRGTSEIYMLYGNDYVSAQSVTLQVPEDYQLTADTEYLLWDLIRPRLHVMYTPNSNWLLADYTYEEFYGDPSLFNDIHTTSGTSTTSGNTIFLATERGAYVIDERQGDEENADQKRYYI